MYTEFSKLPQDGAGQLQIFKTHVPQAWFVVED